MTLTSGCSLLRPASITKTYFALDTDITITLYNTKEEALIDSCFDICSEYEGKFSKTIPTSDIAKINAAHGETIEVSPETAYLIKQSVYYSDLSNGLFDITIAPVTTLWNFSSKQITANRNTIPAKADLDSALKHVGYHNIVVDGNDVTLKDPDAAIDLGGIAKGYIADRLKDYLVSQGVKSGIIDLGGNILLIGSKPDKTPYHIGIRRPFSKTGEPITSVEVVDASVVTSGIYERCFTYQDKLYHHVLSPSDGYPIENDLNSVTIVSASSMTCDALSTSCLLLGLEDGMKLINSLPDVEAVFITKDNQIHQSNKLSK